MDAGVSRLLDVSSAVKCPCLLSVWALLTTFGFFRHDIANVVLRAGAKYIYQTLRTLHTLLTEAVAARWLLTVTNKVHCGLAECQGQKTEDR